MLRMIAVAVSSSSLDIDSAVAGPPVFVMPNDHGVRQKHSSGARLRREKASARFTGKRGIGGGDDAARAHEPDEWRLGAGRDLARDASIERLQ